MLVPFYSVAYSKLDDALRYRKLQKSANELLVACMREPISGWGLVGAGAVFFF